MALDPIIKARREIHDFCERMAGQREDLGWIEADAEELDELLNVLTERVVTRCRGIRNE